jgi:hypothetical protein
MVSPSALAVLRFTTISYFVGSCTGRSPAFSPRLSTRRDLREQHKPLASQRGFEVGEASDVPTRAVEPRDDTAGDGVADIHKDDRDNPRLPLDGNGRQGRVCHHDVWLQADTPARTPVSDWCQPPPMKVHTHVAAIGPTQVRKRLRERGEASLRLGIIFVVRHEHADASHPLARLRARCDRPNRGAPEPRDEIPPFHSITRSARARKASGIVTPIAFAVTY